MILPSDKSGNFVLLLEPRKAIGRSVCSIRRCYFYFLCVLCEERFSEIKTATILAFMDDLQIDEGMNKLTFVDINNVFPFDLSFIHCFLGPIGLHLTSSKSSAEEYLTKLFQPWKGQILPHTLSNVTPKSFFISHDLDSLNLPCRIGGTWMFSLFKQWQRERLAFEFDEIRNISNHKLVHISNEGRLITAALLKTNDHRFITNVTYQKKQLKGINC